MFDVKDFGLKLLFLSTPHLYQISYNSLGDLVIWTLVFFWWIQNSAYPSVKKVYSLIMSNAQTLPRSITGRLYFTGPKEYYFSLETCQPTLN